MDRNKFYRDRLPCPFFIARQIICIQQMSKRIRHTQQNCDNPKKRERFCKAIADMEIGYDYVSCMPMLLEKIMDEIVEYATKTGMDSYFLLKHYQFTNKEIEEYFDRIGRDAIS